jgi:serine/threonine protein kinase
VDTNNREGMFMGLQIGTTLANRFEIRSQIGAGAFGAVYLAYDHDLNRLVAIKELSTINTGLGTTDYRAQKQKFEREARALSQFQHPNVVGVHQRLHEETADYLVLEYVAGGSLRAQLDSVHRLSVERSVAIALDICRAITAMSKFGVVHRDIKPGNILLTADGIAKLTDFGIAQLNNTSEGSQAVGTRQPGTPKYMSPEQEKSIGRLDERSDLFSLGLVLYEMLTGESYKPARRPVRKINREVPRWLDNVLIKLLQPDPGKRYQTARELELALRQSPQKKGVPLVVRGGLAALVVLALVTVGGLLIVSTSSATIMSTPTATPIRNFSQVKTATPTITPTSTATPTLSPPTATRAPSSTPAALSTDTATPAPIPPTATRVRILNTATPVSTQPPACPRGQFWDPIMSRCKNQPGGGGGGGGATIAPP